MNKEDLKRRVDKVIELSGDDERAHGYEDSLHLKIIHEFCPDWVVKEVERLSDADFGRWYA